MNTRVHDAKQRVREEFDRLAPEYEQRWHQYVEASVRETLRRTRVEPGQRILDVGCGTGTLLDAITSVVPDVRAAGVDLSPAMARASRRRLGGRAAVLVGDAEALPFGSGTFDVVVSSSSFHFWPQPQRSLQELRRVLRSGGRLVLTDWCDDYLACRVCDAVLRWFDTTHRRIISSSQCETVLRETGFSDVQVDRYRITWLWGLMTATGTS